LRKTACILIFLLLTSAHHGRGSSFYAPSGADADKKISLHLNLPLTRARGQVLDLVLSPDGRILVPATRDNKTELWDTETGRLIATVKGRDATFSPDGQTLATVDGQNARLWNPNTGELKHLLRGHKEDIVSIIFSPDGRTLATGSEDGTARLWEVESGQSTSTLTVFHVYPRWRIVSRFFSINHLYCAFSPDGRKILTVSLEQPATLWDVRTGRVERVFDQKECDRGKFSPTGRFVLTGGTSGSRLWEAATGELKAEFTSYDAVFSSDERWLGMVESDGKKGLLYLNTMKIEIPVDLPINDFVSWMRFSPDNKVFVQAYGLNGHSAAVVDTKNGGKIADFPIKARHGFDIISDYLSYTEELSFHPSSQVLMGANHDLIRFWYLYAAGQLAEISEARDPATFSTDGKLLVATSKNRKDILLWDFKIN
jgi:WD40 repeat protein